MSGKNIVVLTLGIALAILSAIVVPTFLVTRAGTERHNACVESGGSYVKVNNSAMFQCEQPGWEN